MKTMDINWKSLANLDVEGMLDWAESQPWALAMRECSQDPVWHAEGDVWTHTVRVCRELPGIEGWDSLARNDQTILALAALFHDCAKPITTTVDPTDGRLRSPGHAVKGEMLARNTLKNLDCPFHIREQVCNLVRYHGKPMYVVQSERPEIEIARLSWVLRHDLLFAIAMADLRGRTSLKTNRSDDDLVWYRSLAEEHHCWTQPYQLPNERARFLLGRRELTDLHYVPYEDFHCSVVLMSGLPGSGKDTWLREHRPELPVVSLDDLRQQMGISPDENQGKVVQAARERCREFLRAKRPFAINGTNTSCQIRSQWVELCADYHARIEIVYLESTLEETLTQNRKREKSVPESVIHRLDQRTNPPTLLEGHQVRYVISQRLNSEERAN